MTPKNLDALKGLRRAALEASAAKAARGKSDACDGRHVKLLPLPPASALESRLQEVSHRLVGIAGVTAACAAIGARSKAVEAGLENYYRRLEERSRGAISEMLIAGSSLDSEAINLRSWPHPAPREISGSALAIY